MGCPQGGVLSALIWILVFDGLLERFAQGRVKCIGYADDGALIIEGEDLGVMYRLMNYAIKEAVQWAEECGLQISPEKTVAVLFTRKTKKLVDQAKPNFPLKIGEKTLILQEEVKYLGVTLDKRLTWNKHITNKVCQARKGALHDQEYNRQALGSLPRYHTLGVQKYGQANHKLLPIHLWPIPNT